MELLEARVDVSGIMWSPVNEHHLFLQGDAVIVQLIFLLSKSDIRRKVIKWTYLRS